MRTVVVAVVLLTAAGCSDADDRSIETSTTASDRSSSSTVSISTSTTTTAPGAISSTTMTPSVVALAQVCTTQGGEYSVEYPAGWSTNSGEVSPPCSYFHPEPFEVPEATEVVDLAITLKVEPVAFETVAGPDEQGARELSRTETTLDGRQAVRVESESTGDALLPEGIRSYRYAVNLDGATFVAVTHGVEELDYAANKTVLDQMMDSLELAKG